MIGLGRMAANMVERLLKAGHKCVVNDTNADTVQLMAAKGARGTTELPEFIQMLEKPRAVWLMLPAAAVDPVLHPLVPLLEPGDIVIEGGNSHYHDDGGDERRLAGCPATSLPAMAFAAEIGVVELDPAGRPLAGIPLEHDLLQLVFDLPGGGLRHPEATAQLNAGDALLGLARW